MADLDEILEKDQDSKINWLISELWEIKHEIKNIKSNHLYHINEDIIMLKRKMYIICGVIITFLTGQNILM
mgnify:FL=1|tara:strand:+ start:101 stop:313 length:213 start_codon:yes stop_codon:yes gene_type:complete